MLRTRDDMKSAMSSCALSPQGEGLQDLNHSNKIILSAGKPLCYFQPKENLLNAPSAGLNKKRRRLSRPQGYKSKTLSYPERVFLQAKEFQSYV
jgi:hypothetical protein